MRDNGFGGCLIRVENGGILVGSCIFPWTNQKWSLQIREDRQVKSDFVGPASCFYKMGNFNKSSKGVLV